MRQLFFLAAVAAFCSNCATSLLGNRTDEAASYSKAIEAVRRNVDGERFKIFSLCFSEEQELSDNLHYMVVKLVSRDDRALTQTYFMNGMQPSSLRGLDRTFDAPAFATTRGIDLDELDPELIAAQIARAKTMLPEGHSFESVGSYTIEEVVPAGEGVFNCNRDVGARKCRFVIRFTEDGKETESNAGQTFRIYYEAEVTVAPDGSLSISGN